MDGEDRPSRLAREPVPRALQLQPRQSRSAVPRARPQPARLRHFRARSGAQLRRRACRRRWSPRVFNDLRIGFNSLRRENLPQASGTDGFSLLGIHGPALDSVDLGYPTFVLPGYESLGDDANLPVVRKTKTIHISDSLEHRQRPPPLQAGRRAAALSSRTGSITCSARGEATFLGAYTGHPVADLLLGFPTFTLLAANDNRQALRTNAINLFAQDDWRITPTLTVNAGVRYEYNQPPYDTDDRMRIYDAATNSMRQVGEGGLSRSGLNGDFNNFAPRVGASWDLTGQGTWLLRGGYGMFYDSGTLIENSALYFNEPYWALQLFFPSETAPIFLNNPFPADGGFTPTPAVNTLDPNFRTAYSHQGSVALERAFVNTTITARYVTSHGRNFVRKRNVNQADAGTGRSRSAAADRGLRRHPARRVAGDVELSRDAVERRAPSLQGPLVPRLLHAVEGAGRRLGVPGDGWRRQHAAGQPQRRGRVGPVGLRRASSPRVDDDLGSAGEVRLGHARGLHARLAGERDLLGAVGTPVHAARQLRQQQQRQHGRRHVRLRSPERR